MYPERDYGKLLDELRQNYGVYIVDPPMLEEIEVWEIRHKETDRLVFKGEYRDVKEVLRKMYKENLTLVDVDTMISIGKEFTDVVKNISAENVFQINYKKELKK